MIGFLYPGRKDAEFDSWRLGFAKALVERSWREGDNLLIEWRFGEYDQTRYDRMAAELISAGADVLVTAGTPLTHALSRATQSIPIVTSVGDPVGSGFAVDLQSPGHNITGLSRALREKARAQIGLLVEMAPGVKTLMVPRSERYGGIPELDACLEGVAAECGMDFTVRTAESFAEVEFALGALAGPATAATFVYAHGAFQFDESTFASAAIRYGVVAAGDERRTVEAGCLMSYGLHHPDPEKSYASLVDRVLRGENPARIPFEMPTVPEIIVNRATAVALGLALAPELLQRADAVIE